MRSTTRLEPETELTFEGIRNGVILGGCFWVLIAYGLAWLIEVLR